MNFSFWGPACFQVRTVSFREGKCIKQLGNFRMFHPWNVGSFLFGSGPECLWKPMKGVKVSEMRNGILYIRALKRGLGVGGLFSLEIPVMKTNFWPNYDISPTYIDFPEIKGFPFLNYILGWGCVRSLYFDQVYGFRVSIQPPMYFDLPKMGGKKTSNRIPQIVIYWRFTPGRSKSSPSTNPSVSVVQQAIRFTFINSSFANIPTATVSRTCVAWVWPEDINGNKPLEEVQYDPWVRKIIFVYKYTN